MIDYFFLNREYLFLKKNFRNKLENIFKNKAFLQGKETLLLEKNLREYSKKKYCVSVNSCTDSLYFALKSISNNNKHRKVLITSYSWISSLTCVLRANLKPELIDLDNKSFKINKNELEKKLNKNIHSVIYTPLFGDIGDIKEILRLKKKYKFKLIIDAAQSFGSAYLEKDISYYGDIVCLSFDPTKNLASLGSGGALLTNDKKIFLNVKALRYHGKLDNKFIKKGYNSQLSEFSAAYLNLKMKYFDIWNKKRLEVNNLYSKYFQKNEHVEFFPKILNKNNFFSKFSCHKYVLVLKKKKIRDYLLLNIKSFKPKIHYDYTLSDFVFFKTKNKFINSNKLKKKIISLPINPWLKKEEVKKIINEVNFLLKNFNKT